MKTLYEYIAERKAIGGFKRNYTIDIQMVKSTHAEERQSRHGEDERNYISDDEIRETVRQASDTIITDVLRSKINIGDRFIVRDANTDINIVCQLNNGRDKDQLQVDIITVMRSADFHNPHGTWVVMVR